MNTLIIDDHDVNDQNEVDTRFLMHVIYIGNRLSPKPGLYKTIFNGIEIPIGLLPIIMANINLFFHFLLLILCTGFLHYIDSELINNKPLRLKRSTIPNRRSQGKYQPTQQQKEPIHHEEDEQTILDEQEQDVISLNNGTHGLASNGVTMNDCGISLYATKDVERIVGGQPAMPGQFPWQVYLRIVTSGGDMLCGGSILNPNWILTAAHCISNEQSGMYMANQIEVIAGSLDRFSYGSERQSRYADCALKHPKWTGVSGGFANDIALIRLPQYDPLDLNGYNVRGVCLPPKRYPPFDYNGVARVAGWGLTRDRGSPSRTLQYTDVNMITDKYDL